jgi:putative membrane protein
MNLVKKWFFRGVLFIIFLIALVAASENSADVSLKFLDYRTPEWPVSWWVLIAFVIGLGLGSLLNFVSNTQLRLRHREAEKKIAATNRQLDNIKVGPYVEHDTSG